MGNSSSARYSLKGSSVITTPPVLAESETGSHLFKVLGYSLTRGIGIGEFICSDVFTVGGYSWQIKFYPAGETIENQKFIALYLELKSAATDVKAKYTFTILRRNNFYYRSLTAPVRNFNDTDDISWGWPKFVERSSFEKSKFIKNDAFTIKCTITLVRNLQATTTYSITAPTSNLSRHFVHLLESGHGSDVTFVVKGVEFNAHRCVLAARSAVFSAELLSYMEDNRKKIITIHDIEPAAFKSMLYFIYSDSLPYYKKQDLRLMAQHLLIAADR
ncbi:hypothetical protein LUZ61_007247 [Rhynchospora tenuis]|uniref:BTB domain-containing protein n=1 Tax=Rhynchospora tenuis TaxID=198213 RepID=A0AAD6EW90_9POAL|nr:hypothetical protein LUZ61_007247 [Rhynchospora tenuis]